jgi:hypothetical protein
MQFEMHLYSVTKKKSNKLASQLNCLTSKETEGCELKYEFAS